MKTNILLALDTDEVTVLLHYHERCAELLGANPSVQAPHIKRYAQLMTVLPDAPRMDLEHAP